MRDWLLLTGGLAIWAVHFLGVYAISSLGDVAARADDLAWRMAALGFSLACVAAEGAFLFWTARAGRSAGETGLGRFVVGVGLTGGIVGLVGVVWQAAPTLVGY